MKVWIIWQYHYSDEPPLVYDIYSTWDKAVAEFQRIERTGVNMKNYGIKEYDVK